MLWEKKYLADIKIECAVIIIKKMFDESYLKINKNPYELI